jgi:RNA polymerase sigma factor (sigma-70 family)
MARGQTADVAGHSHGADPLRECAGMSDERLLTDFLGRREGRALAALVHRHGPMVWGVCRRILPHWHDAEDAFQATFLVLVRRASAIASRELLANWLYGVARQTALKARATAAKRATREGPKAMMPEPAVEPRDLWQDLRTHFDEALGRLPDKYREVVVMCELEGKTRKEAARQLGVPEGTVSGRLARAKAMLAKRLAPHVLGVTGAGLALLLSRNTASAAVPDAVLSSTVKAASLFAANPAAAVGIVSAKVIALSEGVVKSMIVTKLKAVLAGFIALAVLAGGVGLFALRTQADEPAAKPEENAKTDAESLQGEWAAKSVEIDGKDYTAQKAKSWTLTIDGDKVKGMTKTGDELSFKLDATKKPKEIDLAGERTELARKAIYELDGDTLKVCWSQDGTVRPTDFTSTSGVLAVYERKKK